MEFRILGPLEVFDGSRRLEIGAGKQRALLALLLINANEVVPSERLIDALWDETPPTTAAKALQNAVSQLRRALADGAAVAGEGRLATRGGGYILGVGEGELDLDVFERMTIEGREALASGAPDVAATKLREALALWRGPALADFSYAGFAQSEIARVDDLRVVALEDRIEAELALGRHAALVAEIQALAARYPLRERLRAQLMLALYRSGRQAEALAAYREARDLLGEELGLEPSQELQSLHRAILRQHPALALPAARAAGKRADAPLAGEDPREQPDTRRPQQRGASRPWLRGAAAGVLVFTLATAVAVLLYRSRTDGEAVVAQGNALAVVDVEDGTVVASVPVGRMPRGLTASADAVWVANTEDGTITGVDTPSRRAVTTVGTGSTTPTDVVAADGAVWAVNPIEGAVSRIDPQTGSVQVAHLPERVSDPGTETDLVHSDGSIWVALRSLWRINTATLRFERVARLPSYPHFHWNTGTAMAAHGDRLWLTVGPRTVWGVDMRTGRRVAEVAVAGAGAIAASADAVWITAGLDELWRVDPTVGVAVATIRVGRDPVDVAVGQDAVWVAAAGDGTVSRVDPSTNSVVETIAVGARPTALALNRDELWVSVRER